VPAGSAREQVEREQVAGLLRAAPGNEELAQLECGGAGRDRGDCGMQADDSSSASAELDGLPSPPGGPPAADGGVSGSGPNRPPTLAWPAGRGGGESHPRLAGGDLPGNGDLHFA